MGAQKSKNLELGKLQKTIYSNLKSKAESLEGTVSKELVSYRKDQELYEKKPFSPCKFETLLKSINHSHIIYLGDFHTFDQSSRNLQRLIKVLAKNNSGYVLGVEFIHQKNQQMIDSFLAGQLTELEFLESIQYRESWRFPWTYYRQFFELAKKYKIKIYGLNTDGNLKKRDRFAAKILAKIHKKDPHKKILVLFGEYHILPDKLPNDTLNELNGNVHQTIIHQNLDSVYWNIANTKGGTDRLVKFSDNEFALQTSPPWIKYESMIYWFEHLGEDPEFDIHEFIMETGVFTFNSNAMDNFVFIADQLNSTLKLDLSSSDIEDFNLYDHERLEFVQKKVQGLNSKTLQSFYLKLLTRNRSFRIPGTKNYYCPSYSINRLAYLAGVHLYLQLLHKQKKREDDCLIGTRQYTKFIFFCYQSFMGYFSSKIINPYRKCDRYQDFLKCLRNKKTSAYDKKILRLCLRVIDSKTKTTDIFNGVNILDTFLVARKIGYLMADDFFEEIFHRDHQKTQIVLNTLFSFKFCPEEFEKLIHVILPRTSYRKAKKTLF